MHPQTNYSCFIFLSRNIFEISVENSTDFRVQRIEANFEKWILKHSTNEDECENCNELSTVAKTTQVLLIMLCSTLFVGVILGITVLARNQLLKKRISKGPYKVLLTAADFVFPQVADSRRVSYYI